MNESQSLKQQHASLKNRAENLPVKVKMYILLLMSVKDDSLIPQIPKSIRQHHEPTLKIFKKFTPN